MKKERNYGIDLLRVISMLFVVILHSLGQGGILNNVVIDSNQYMCGWFLKSFVFCAVNIFALISGYVAYTGKDKRVKYSRFFNLWMQVVFYGLLITIIFNIIKPELVTTNNYIEAILPVLNNSYWYVTAFAGLYILMPFLNKAINYCEESTLKKLFVSILIIFSTFATYFGIFDLNRGYSFVWLVLMYIMGAIIKKCDIGKNIKTYQAFLGILVLSLITFLYRIYSNEYKVLNRTIEKDLLINYTSPTILGISILYVISFSKFKFNDSIKNIITFFSTSAFSIYIINTNVFIWFNVMENLFAKYAKKSSIKILVYVLGFSVVFVIGSVLIDKIRILIFKIIKADKACEKMEKISNKVITKLSEFV